MQARRDEVKHMKHRHLGYYDNIKHAVKVRRSAPPEILRSSGTVPIPLLFQSPLLCAVAWDGGGMEPSTRVRRILPHSGGGGELGRSAAEVSWRG